MDNKDTSKNTTTSTPNKEKDKPKQNNDIAVIILVVLLIITVIFAAYEHLLHVDAENTRKVSHTPQTSIYEETPTVPEVQPITPEKAEERASTLKMLSDVIEDISETAITIAGGDLISNYQGSTYPISFIIKPEGALTSFPSSSYTYSLDVSIHSPNKTDIENYQNALIKRFEFKGYKPTNIFYEASEGKLQTGYIDEAHHILCAPLNYYESEKYQIFFQCAYIGKLSFYSDSIIATYNDKAEAYKKSTGNYPAFLKSSDYGIVLYGENNKRYHFLSGMTASQYPEYFYQEWDTDGWKFAGNDICTSKRTMSEEEKSLFVCVEEGDWTRIGLRGNF